MLVGEKDAAYDSWGELGATLLQCLNTKNIMAGPFTAPYHPINLNVGEISVRQKQYIIYQIHERFTRLTHTNAIKFRSTV